MDETGAARQRIERRRVQSIGFVLAFIGVCLLVVYPLAPAEIIPGSYPIHSSGALESSQPVVVYLSTVGGPVLLVWGLFVFQSGNLRPLTPSRTLLAPVLSALGSIAGVGRFTYEWLTATPFVSGATQPTTVDPPVSEIVLLELTGVQFVALAAVSTMVVGAIATRRGWRSTIVSALLPTGFVALALADIWQFSATVTEVFLGTAVLAVVPFAVGYVATRSD